MILWFTGFPGVGKTTFLQRRLPPGTACLSVDQLRDELHRSKPHGGFRPTSSEQEAIHESPLLYVEYSRCVGEQIWHAYEERFTRMARSGRWVVEISPFLLAAFPNCGNRTFLRLAPEAHAARLARRHGFGAREARALLDFYRCSLELADVTVNRCVDLDALEAHDEFDWGSQP
jgi:hypothetical protein